MNYGALLSEDDLRKATLQPGQRAPAGTRVLVSPAKIVTAEAYNAALGVDASSRALTHFRNDARLRVTLDDGQGNTRTEYGPSDIELLSQHIAGTCGAFCGWCYEAGCRALDQTEQPRG